MTKNPEPRVCLISIKTHRRAGSVFLLSVGILSLLAILSSLVFAIVSNRHRQAFQTASWHEAMIAAESGVDIAVTAIQQQLSTDDEVRGKAFESWTDGADGMKTYLNTARPLQRAGEGSQLSWCEVVVEKPAALLVEGKQWWRVRSTGYSRIPGNKVLAAESVDIKLRKLDFYFDHRKYQKNDAGDMDVTPKPVSEPQVSRLVEVIVKPVGPFDKAIKADEWIDMNNHNPVVDSYDPRKPSASTNGFYDPAKAQSNGDIASNGPIIDLGDAHIYGDAATNGGEVLNASNVTGEIRDDFYQELYPVKRPEMTASPSTPSSIHDTTVVDASALAPTRMILSKLDLSGSETLTIQGADDGSPRSVIILVNGDVDIRGRAQFILGLGVTVEMYVVGDATFTGGGVANPNSAINFQVYGVAPLPGDAAGSFTIAGAGGFRGAVYAPNSAITLVGGGSGAGFFGSIVGRTVTMTGGQAVHYDESMAGGGLTSDYLVVSWFEDTR